MAAKFRIRPTRKILLGLDQRGRRLKSERLVNFFKSAAGIDAVNKNLKERVIVKWRKINGRKLGKAEARFLEQAKELPKFALESKPRQFRKKSMAAMALDELNSNIFDEKNSPKPGTHLHYVFEDPKEFAEWQKKWRKDLPEIIPLMLATLEARQRIEGNYYATRRMKAILKNL